MLTDQSTGIMYRKWIADDNEAVLLLVHGMGAHSARWNLLADFFCSRGISSYAIELKGFGETEDLKGHIDSFDIYMKDIRNLQAIVRKENSDKKIFLLGESLGGLICFNLAIEAPFLFDGLICISPAFLGIMKVPMGRILLSAMFKPTEQFEMPFNSAMCTRDKDIQNFMDNDSREHRLASAKLLIGTAGLQINSVLKKKKLKLPTLFLLPGEKDALVSSKPSISIFKALKIRDKKLIEYPDMMHALSIDIGREKVFEDIYKWVDIRS